MGTKVIDLDAMALALASAKKPCPECNDHWDSPPEYLPCKVCGATQRGLDIENEVYVLGPEVRVDCEGVVSIPGERIWRTDCPARFPERFTSFTPDELKRVQAQDSCEGRGWNPLDVRYGWDWMVAVESVGISLVVYPPSHLRSDPNGWGVMMPDMTSIGYCTDTPGLAFFQAAMKALNLDTGA